MHQPKDPELRDMVGPPSFGVGRADRELPPHSLMRAHRPVISQLESLDEDGGHGAGKVTGAAVPDFQQLRRKLHQKEATCKRLQVSSAVGGDQVYIPHGNQLQEKQRHRPQVVYYMCIPAGGDQQIKLSPLRDPASRLTVTETSTELLRHQRCPRRRPQQSPAPQPMQKKPHGRLDNSDSSIQAVTDSLMTSTTPSSDSLRNGKARGPERLNDEDQQATCTDTFTESRSSDGGSPPATTAPAALAVRCPPAQLTKADGGSLPHTSSLNMPKGVAQCQATREVTSSPSLALVTPHLPTSVAASRVIGSGGGLKSAASSAAEKEVPPPIPGFPEFKLPAATWAAVTVAAATAAQQLGEQLQISGISTGKSITQKKPPKLQQRQQQQPQQKPHKLKQLPPLPRQSARCPSTHHHTTNGGTLAATSSDCIVKLQQTTSTTSSTATSTTETPPTAVQASASHQQQLPQLPPPARRQQRHPPHQHYQLLPRRRLPRRRDLHRYLPTDSFSAVAGTAPTTTTAEDQLRPLVSAMAHAVDLPQLQLMRPLICRSEPQPTVLATMVAAFNVQQLTETLCAAEVHVEAPIIAAAASVASGAMFDVVVPRLSSHHAAPPRCFRCCLTLVTSSALYQRTAPQLLPQPTLRRNIRHKAIVRVCQQAGDPAAAATSAPTMLALHHHQSDCCLLERLSVTARLLGANKSANCRAKQAPCRSALMSHIYYPEDLVLLPVSTDGDYARGCAGGGGVCGYDGTTARHFPVTKSATWSVAVPSLVTLRARVTMAACDDVQTAQHCLVQTGDIGYDDDEEPGDLTNSDASYDDPVDDYDDDEELYQQAVELREEDGQSTDFPSSSGY